MNDTITVLTPSYDKVTFVLIDSNIFQQEIEKGAVLAGEDTPIGIRPYYRLKDSSVIWRYTYDGYCLKFKNENDLRKLLNNAIEGYSTIFFLYDKGETYYCFNVYSDFVCRYTSLYGRRILKRKLGIHDEFCLGSYGDLVVLKERTTNVFNGVWFPNEQSCNYYFSL